MQKRHIRRAIGFDIGPVPNPKDAVSTLAEVEQIAVNAANGLSAQSLIKTQLRKHLSPPCYVLPGAFRRRGQRNIMLLEHVAQQQTASVVDHTEKLTNL